jgi:hypothetical protein
VLAFFYNTTYDDFFPFFYNATSHDSLRSIANILPRSSVHSPTSAYFAPSRHSPHLPHRSSSSLQPRPSSTPLPRIISLSPMSFRRCHLATRTLQSSLYIDVVTSITLHVLNNSLPHRWPLFLSKSEVYTELVLC